MNTSIITGITGQDGSYLAEHLLDRGDHVHGIVRRSSQFNRRRIDALRDRFPDRLNLHYADLSDTTPLRRILTRLAPDEIYHLAGQSHVGLSFEIPESTVNEITVSTLALLEICRDLDPAPRILLASSSEIFGTPEESPQTERTPHRPTSPYGCAKSCAAQLGAVYRDAFDLFVATTIAYNHESVRRGENFVTRKITRAAARIARGSDEILELGNLSSSRDWGYAPEYVEAKAAILAHDTPEDFILATGELTSVRDYARAAFAAIGQNLQFEGKGLKEQGVVDGKIVLTVNERFFRPVDSQSLVGSPAKAKKLLGWSAQTRGPQVASRIMAKELELLDS